MSQNPALIAFKREKTNTFFPILSLKFPTPNVDCLVAVMKFAHVFKILT